MEDLRERLSRSAELTMLEADLTGDALARLGELVTQNPGRAPLRFVVRGPPRFATASVSSGPRWRFTATPKFVDGIGSLFGPDALRLFA